MIENLVTQFKNNNEEYLNKIKQTAEEKVKSVLTDSKLLLKVATLSIIESLRRNPELCNFVLYNTSVVTASATAYGSNYLSLMSSGRQPHQQQSFNDTYAALIVEEAEKLYNEITTEVTNSVMIASADIMASSLPLPVNNNNNQKLMHKNDET